MPYVLTDNSTTRESFERAGLRHTEGGKGKGKALTVSVDVLALYTINDRCTNTLSCLLDRSCRDASRGDEAQEHVGRCPRVPLRSK